MIKPPGGGEGPANDKKKIRACCETKLAKNEPTFSPAPVYTEMRIDWTFLKGVALYDIDIGRHLYVV